MGNSKAVGKDFTQGNVMGLMIPFLSMFILANLLNSLYNTVDTAVIGQYVGNIGTVAVTTGGKMLNMLTFVGTGISGAGQILLAQQMGAKRRDEMNETIGTMFSILLIAAVALGTLTVLLAKPILAYLNTPEEAFPSALAYLRITSIGLPLMFGYNAISSVLRAMGDSRKPLIFIAVASVINLILDIILIRCFSMGAMGTAIATVAGQGVSFLLAVAILYRRREEFCFDFQLSSFRIKADKLKTILQIGLPMIANSLLISLAQLYSMKFVNDYGLVQASAYGIGDKVIHLMNTLTTSIKSAAGAMVGQNIGARKYDRVKTIVKCGLLLSGCSAAVMSGISLIFPEALFRCFTKDADVLAYSTVYMQICALVFVLSAIMCGFAPVVTGTGNAKLSFIGGILDGVVLRVGLGLLLGVVFQMESVGFFLGNAVCRIGPIILYGWYYFSGAWMRFKKLA